MLFGRQAGHGLEPVCIVRRAEFHGPVLHGVGHHVGNGGIKSGALLQYARQLVGELARKALAHDIQTKDIAAKGGVGLGGRPLQGGVLDGGKQGLGSSGTHGNAPLDLIGEDNSLFWIAACKHSPCHTLICDCNSFILREKNTILSQKGVFHASGYRQRNRKFQQIC